MSETTKKTPVPDTPPEHKRGRGRPRKYTDDNPKPKKNEKNPLEVIHEPRFNTAANPTTIPEGDNNKYTSVALAIMEMPRIDKRDPEQLQKRINEYFALCAKHDMKPSVAGIGLSTGLDRRRLWEINSGVNTRGLPQECVDIIRQAYAGLEMLWESYMQNGKINPVSGIFLGKNHFGYRDQQDVVVSPGQQDIPTPEAIEAKYAELPDD
ncbi:MAG: hypothetical protein IJ449_00020 [Clostridia bacterium]|nr:hypothetical protein [Clostridia bacterium]